MRHPGFLRIVVTAVVAGVIGLQWLLPPDPEPGRRRPPPPRHEQGRRPEPDRWPETRVPVRLAAVPGAADAAGGEEPARSRSLDQPDIFMRDNPPAEWTSGTAFAVGVGGALVTAAHVTRGCAQVAVVPETRVPRPVFAVEVVQHAGADVAVVHVPHAAPALSLGDDGGLGRGATGFGFGYPAGVASAVVGELMGRARGRGDGDRGWWPVMVWALVGREPDGEGGLGGISGGPMLDETGRVIGVVIASGSERRPRFVTTTVAPVLEALEGLVAPGPPPAGGPTATIHAGDAADYGRSLRGRGSVVPAICHRDAAGTTPEIP